MTQQGMADMEAAYTLDVDGESGMPRVPGTRPGWIFLWTISLHKNIGDLLVRDNSEVQYTLCFNMQGRCDF